MKKISYTYATANNPDGTVPVYGQIQSENHPNGTVVSALTMNSATRRTETRGDGTARTFNYSNGKLLNSTDFKGVTASQTCDASGYVNSVTDRRGSRTDYVNEPLTGHVTLKTHPLTAFDGGIRPTVQTVYGSASCPDVNNRDGNNPYYIYSVKNERGYTTVYQRDSNKRITQIKYPNGAYETFAYNPLGLVTSHRVTSGGVETFTYYGLSEYGGALNGLLREYRDPSRTVGTPANAIYAYYTSGPSLGRVQSVTDARNNRTEYQYNVRGQITRVTHSGPIVYYTTGAGGGGAYIQNEYNSDGTLAWSADENHPGATSDANQRTRFVYDDYKRIISVTNPMNQRTDYDYRLDWVNSYLHTSTAVKASYSPLRKGTHFGYDANLRRTIVREAAGAAGDAWTYLGYDAVGNLSSTTDPRGNVTTYGYDQRNRRTSATNPAPLNAQVTRWEYDAISNITKEIRPDATFRRVIYDAMNRVTDTYGYGNEHTGYRHDLAGNIEQITDAKGAIYGFDFDASNRKLSATYPADIGGVNRTETWRYDGAGNIVQYKNPTGQYKTISYDFRNRPDRSSWSDNTGPTVDIDYDAASRITRIATNTNQTVLAFGYDAANRQIWEEQTLAGLPTRRVETSHDVDGNRTDLKVVGSYALKYTYTNRNQLSEIRDGNNLPWFQYSYDPSGNMTKRQAVYGGVNDSTNCPTASYDALNRPLVWEQTGRGDSAFARTHQQYDNLSRLTAIWRDEQGTKGERYGYNVMGQLTSVKYNADQVWTGVPLNPTDTVSYNLDALNRIGTNGVNENGTLTAYTPNAINQYTAVGGDRPNYSANFNLLWNMGWKYSYDAENRLTTAENGAPRASFVYDGLGRCVKRVIDGVTTLFTYDGWKPIVEWNGGGVLVAWNIYGAGADEILWRYQTGIGHLRYHLDRQGNVAFLLDSNGNGLERYTYDAFGHPTVINWDGSGERSRSNYGNRFMFTGREYVAALGLYDYRNRFYHPKLGRFLQPDPIGFGGGDANLFRYCAGDPVNNTDPNGLDMFTDIRSGRVSPQDAAASLSNFSVYSSNPFTSSQQQLQQSISVAQGQFQGLAQGVAVSGGVLVVASGVYYAPQIVAAALLLMYSPLTQKIIIYATGIIDGLTPGSGLPTNVPQVMGNVVQELISNEHSPLKQAIDVAKSPNPSGSTGGHGGGGERGNGGIFSGSGPSSPFTNNSGYGFITGEGGSAFGFSVDLSQAGANAYFGGGFNPDGTVYKKQF